MKIFKESVNHYTSWMKEGRYFSFAGLSDAEWYCILGHRCGDKTGLGQIISPEHGEILLDVVRRRSNTDNFMFAVPDCLWPTEGPKGEFIPGLPGFAEGQIDWFLGRERIPLVGWERDRVLDDLARDAGLFPWIKEFSRHRVCLIGPKELRGTKEFLNWRWFVEIESPNLHMTETGIDDAVRSALAFGSSKQDIVYLVSAGVSAAVIIDRLHDTAIKNDSWCLDMGSVWDAFVGIGGQREWRKNLYADKVKWDKWKFDNLNGKDGRGW